MPESIQQKRSLITLIALITAGEAIFFLPFILARIFRPTLLEVFDISNTELGYWFSIYGIVAMVSYLFGGTLADRFQARNLMALALWLTSAGGIVMTLLPAGGVMRILYGFWGFTTICLFWASMIRATREWGGAGFQGRAFGWLEGGRGAVAALLGTGSYFIFSWFQDFKFVILSTSVLTLISGFFVWFFVPVSMQVSRKRRPKPIYQEVVNLLGKPSIWLLTVIIICAYAGYKITDDFSLYAREILGYSELRAAGIGTAALWIRALVAIFAGYMADKFNRIDVIATSFILSLSGSLLIGFGILDKTTGIVLLKLILTATGIYGVRALYFAVMKEARIPIRLTGTAVGIVSFAGFTPEIFMSPWMGHLLDRYPGSTGHQYVFLLLSLFAFIGLVASMLLRLGERNHKFIKS